VARATSSYSQTTSFKVALGATHGVLPSGGVRVDDIVQNNYLFFFFLFSLYHSLGFRTCPSKA